VKERDHSLELSYEEKVATMSPKELHTELEKENIKLAELGVKMPVGWMLNKAQNYGSLYEDRRYKEGAVKPTAMNCFMSLLRYQPDLRNLRQEQFEKLGQTVSRIAVAADVFIEKTGGGLIPEPLSQSPQSMPERKI